LREDTFEPLRASEAECDVHHEVQTSTTYASSSLVSEDNITQKQLVFRGPKKSDKQGDHANGTVILVGHMFTFVFQRKS